MEPSIVLQRNNFPFGRFDLLDPYIYVNIHIHTRESYPLLSFLFVPSFFRRRRRRRRRCRPRFALHAHKLLSRSSFVFFLYFSL